MPIAAPIVAALIGAAATATEVGVQLSGAGQPSTPKPAAAPPSSPTVDQAKALIAPQAMSIESATGGSVSPDYLSTIAPIAAGVGGQPNTNNAVQQLLQQIFGKGGGNSVPGSTGGAGTAPFTPSGLPVNLASLSQTPGASDFLSKISGGLT